MHSEIDATPGNDLKSDRQQTRHDLIGRSLAEMANARLMGRMQT
jgi:hypothetical protein